MIQIHNSIRQPTTIAATASACSISNINITTTVAEDGELHCGRDDLTGTLGLFVQALLAFIAFGALVIKRFCEPKADRRSWKIWFFDTSKQAVGAAGIHFANVFLAQLFQGDPCTWYIVSFLLDSTVGLLVIYSGLKVSQIIVVRKGYTSLYLGEYGHPPQCRAFIGQCGLYILVILVEKILMSLLVLFNFWKDVRKFIMSPIKNPKLELVIVMFIVPFFVNAFIFWVVDNFLKRKVMRPTGQHQIDSDASAARYFSAIEMLKFYKRVTPAAADSDSEMLLACEDESDGSQGRGAGRRRSNSQGSERNKLTAVVT